LAKYKPTNATRKAAAAGREIAFRRSILYALPVAATKVKDTANTVLNPSMSIAFQQVIQRHKDQKQDSDLTNKLAHHVCDALAIVHGFPPPFGQSNFNSRLALR
jgi:hypothetical protein